MIKKNRNGFTLIELIITIVIVSILSLLSVYAYEVYVEEAKASEVYIYVNTILKAQELYYMENGRYANSLSFLPTVEDIGYYYVMDMRSTKDFLYSTRTDKNGTLFIEIEKPISSISPNPVGVPAYGVGYIIRYKIVFQKKKPVQSHAPSGFFRGLSYHTKN